jgi:hexosaminidase
MRTLLLLILCSAFTYAQPPATPKLMPLPTSLQPGSGQMLITPAFSVAITGRTEVRLQHAADRFLDDLRRQTGMLPSTAGLSDPSKANLVIHVDKGTKEVQELGEDESYSLEITPTIAKLDAVTALGAMRGLETFLQLVEMTAQGFAVPSLTVKDQPRFPWRGLMFDVSRHFLPIEVLHRNLDGMAAVKLNVFHWHLSDNQGFRVESKRYPKLQQLGSDGFYYTQDQVRDLIAYAHDRGIRVVPEFDMPGHSTAWFVGYPELASAPGPYSIERQWGVFDPAMDPTEDSTYKFLDGFIGEMAKLFPDQYFHIGGDEVNGKQWDANPKIQAFMRAHGLKKNEDLQAYFNKRVQEIVHKHDKTMEGWDEILAPDLPKTIVIQSWRGQDSLAAAAKQGYSGLLSFGYYLDLQWTAARHYAIDPMSGAAANLSPEEKQHILGGEACIWAEYVSPENVDSRVWPRMAAVAERLWSPQNVTDVNSMYDRMDAISHHLDWLGLTHNSNYKPMLRRIAGSDEIAPLKVLADVVEPAKDYHREELATAPPTSADPLNRVIDAARPESETARQFNDLVDAYLKQSSSGGTVSAGDEARMKNWLTQWRDQRAALAPLAANSLLVKEVVPISDNLSSLATAGLAALDYIDQHHHVPQDWTTTQRSMVGAASTPKAQLLLMVAPPIQKLIDAAAGQTATSH